METNEKSLKEKVDELMKEIATKKEDLSRLEGIEVKEIWIRELNEFEKHYKRRQ